MTVSGSVLTSGTTDTDASTWTTPSISIVKNDLIIVTAAIYNATQYQDVITVSGLSQTWSSLPYQGNATNTGIVSCRYCVASSNQTGTLTIGTGFGVTHDAISYMVSKFSIDTDEIFSYKQHLTTNASNDTTNDTIDLQALGALGSKNLVIGYSGAYNSASEALTFSATTGWTLLGQKDGAAGTSRRLACGLYYAVDTSDTTVSFSVNAPSDRLFGGAAEFAYNRPTYRFPKVMSLIKN